jgi:hypothetical protein
MDKTRKYIMGISLCAISIVSIVVYVAHTNHEGREIRELENPTWLICVVFDNSTTEEEAEAIIFSHNILKPHYTRCLRRPYYNYYISVSKTDFEIIKKRLEKEKYVRLSEKTKIIGGNITVGISIKSHEEETVQRLKSSGIPLKRTITTGIFYGPETPQKESEKIMERLDNDERSISTHIDYLER